MFISQFVIITNRKLHVGLCKFCMKMCKEESSFMALDFAWYAFIIILFHLVLNNMIMNMGNEESQMI